MAIIDVLIVLAFTAYALTAGLRSRKSASKNLDEYFLAGRRLKGWHAGLSMAATQFAADTPLLVTGLIATAGIFSLWRLWIYAVAFLLLGFVLAPGWRRAGVLTDAELTEVRYSGRSAAILRAVKAIYFGTIFNCTVLAMVLFATKEIAEPFLTWHLWLPAPMFDGAVAFVEGIGVPFAREIPGAADVWVRSTDNLISIGALVAVTLSYSATGGLRSVVRTDIGQFAIMIVATAVYAVLIVREAGGMATIGVRLAEMFPNDGSTGITASQILAFTPSHARDASFALLAAFALQWLVQMNADGTGYLAQRCMACRSDEEAKKATVVFTVAQILLRSLLWLPIGLALLVVFPPDPAVDSATVAAREATFVRGIDEVLPPGARGLMLTAMLAALASTIDTHLNWGASYWTNDLYKRFLCRAWLGREPSARSLVWVARLSNVLILVVALAIMTRLSSIQSAWHVSLLLGSGMGLLLVLRWLWWRVTALAELTAIAVSLVLAPLLLFVAPPMSEALRLLILATTASGLGIVAALIAGPEPMSTLSAFYDKTRPAGAWGPVAAKAGKDPRRDAITLLRSAGAVVIASLSVFCVLTGLGSWLVSSPAPAWLPDAGTWNAGLVAVGLAAVPVWWRLAFTDAT